MMAATGSLALVALCLTFGAADVALAKGKPGGGGGGGGGKTSIRLARILFVDESGIQWDRQASCYDPLLDEDWDYWDYRVRIWTALVVESTSAAAVA